MSDGTIIIDTLVNSNGLEKGVNGLGNLAKGGLGLLAKGVAVVGTAMIGAGIASIKLGSDLNEVKNVVDTTFGKNAGQINTWAKSAATSFGIGELAALQMNGTMGAMLKSMGMTGPETLKMSEGITGLSGDMASFYNIDTKDAFEKIRSGISGETEPLKELGINMSVANLSAYALAEGISKPYAKMTQGEQTTLRYNYLMKVTKDAQGDFAKTSGSLANQLRIAQLGVQNLGAAIGASLLPMATGAIKELNGMISTLKTAFDKNGFIGLARALGGVFSQLIVDIAAQAPKMIGIALLVIQSFVTGIQNNLPAITSAAVQVITSLITAFLTLLPQLLTMGLQIIGNLALGIGQALPILIPLAINCIMSLVNALITNLPLLLNAGLQILNGLSQGLITALPLLMTTGATTITSLVNSLLLALPQLIPAIINIIMGIVNMIIANLPQIVAIGIQLLIALATGIANALPMLIEKVPLIINSLSSAILSQLPKILMAGIQIIWILIKGIIAAIPTLIANLPQVILAIVNVMTLFNWIGLGKTLFAKLGQGLGSMGASIASTARSVASGAGNSILNIFKAGLSWGKNLMSSIGGGFSSMGGFLSSSARSVGTGALNAIKGAFSGGLNIGKNLIMGIWNGIGNMKGWILSKIGGFAGSIIQGIKSAFDIHSPSGIMRDLIGKNLVKGIGVGIDVETPNLEKDIDKNLAGLTTKMQATVGYETAKTTTMVAAQHNYKVEGTTTANESSKSSNNQTFIAKLIVDGKEFTQTVVAPNQGVLTSWGDGR